VEKLTFILLLIAIVLVKENILDLFSLAVASKVSASTVISKGENVLQMLSRRYLGIIFIMCVALPHYGEHTEGSRTRSLLGLWQRLQWMIIITQTF